MGKFELQALLEGMMNDVFERLDRDHTFFEGMHGSAVGQLFDQFYSEGLNQLAIFELSRYGSNDQRYPYTLRMGRHGSKAARFSVIDENPIRTPDPKLVKFLVDITTADGDLLIGMIQANVDRVLLSV